jgi:hypothetical protein
MTTPTTTKMAADFGEWLTKTLRVAHVADARDVAGKVVEYLRAHASQPADLLAARDNLAALLADDDTTVFAIDNVHTLADEILCQYHLLMAANEDDSGVCPSPIDYDAAFPPLSQPSPPLSPGSPALPTVDYLLPEPIAPTECAVVTPSFDGSAEAPHFCVPRGAAPQPPSLRIGSLPTRIGLGYYPIGLAPARLLAGYMHTTPPRRLRSRGW